MEWWIILNFLKCSFGLTLHISLWIRKNIRVSRLIHMKPEHAYTIKNLKYHNEGSATETYNHK